MGQVKRRGDFVDFALALNGLECQHTPQSRQLGARARLPPDLGEPMLRAAAREIVADQPESKVIGDEIRPRHEEEHARADEQSPSAASGVMSSG